MNNLRTADAIRPKSFDDIVGQDHLFGQKGVVRRMTSAGRLTNMIFYGPPGTGKTTAAEIIAKNADMVFHRINATTASLSDVKEILGTTDSVFARVEYCSISTRYSISIESSSRLCSNISRTDASR